MQLDVTSSFFFFLIQKIEASLSYLRVHIPASIPSTKRHQIFSIFKHFSGIELETPQQLKTKELRFNQLNCPIVIKCSRIRRLSREISCGASKLTSTFTDVKTRFKKNNSKKQIANETHCKQSNVAMNPGEKGKGKRSFKVSAPPSPLWLSLTNFLFSTLNFQSKH